MENKYQEKRRIYKEIKMRQVIYETKGRAREFNELSINLFTGCDHNCIYCYGADVTHQDKEKFEHSVVPRITLQDVEESAKCWQGDKRRILLCFVTDPYCIAELGTQFTRHTIEILHKYNKNVIILTKGGNRSMRDFDLLTSKDAYATTLTCDNDVDSLKWEPHAGLSQERIEALRQAHDKGIETWVSFEPTIYPEQTRHLLELTKDFVNHYKVGTMNYHPQGKLINWKLHGWNMKRLMDEQGIKYYFKNDLLREMGVLPVNFKQTWVCR